jgi:hypothetical protein
MSTDTPAPVDAPGVRPPSVDYALYAILAECVLSVLASVTLFGERDWLIKQWQKNNTYPNASDQTLRHNFNNFTHQAVIVAIVIALLLILLAKFLREGKGWARWMFVIFTVLPGLPTAYLWNVTNFLINVPAPYRILSGCTGLAALAALVFLFMRTSRPYFRKPGAVAATSPFAALLRPRTAASRTAAPPAAKAAPGSPAGRSAAKPASAGAKGSRGKTRGPDAAGPEAVGPDAVAPDTAGGQPPGAGQPKRSAPRPKSRKAAE